MTGSKERLTDQKYHFCPCTNQKKETKAMINKKHKHKKQTTHLRFTVDLHFFGADNGRIAHLLVSELSRNNFN